MAQTIVLSSAPNQTFSVGVNINGGTTTLRLAVYYNRITGFWVMDIASQAGVPLVTSVPLLTGVWPAANILMPYQYLNIGSAYIINISGTSLDYPNETTLGNGFYLIWDNNVDYVSGQQFGGNVFVVGPPGPQGLPGIVGGIYSLGSSGTLTPSPGGSQFTQQANLTASATIAPPSPILPGGIFLIQLVQPSGGGCTVSFNPFYKGLSGFSLDTTGNTQASLLFQINTAGTSAQLIDVPQNGWPIA